MEKTNMASPCNRKLHYLRKGRGFDSSYQRQTCFLVIPHFNTTTMEIAFNVQQTAVDKFFTEKTKP